VTPGRQETAGRQKFFAASRETYFVSHKFFIPPSSCNFEITSPITYPHVYFNPPFLITCNDPENRISVLIVKNIFGYARAYCAEIKKMKNEYRIFPVSPTIFNFMNAG
jgi:hypothetical protein